ncbi:hypothetical protein JOB18_025000 [Solea senegalensis]|uniref:Uncharacterized protein n=1 Tax=Solea senegalensis TaxID=28829 RepID=A0AAV6QWP2_SOLSE|nr:hypothetical protein JOB18_025000 [Solea senegalensis]
MSLLNVINLACHQERLVNNSGLYQNVLRTVQKVTLQKVICMRDVAINQQHGARTWPQDVLRVVIIIIIINMSYLVRSNSPRTFMNREHDITLNLQQKTVLTFDEKLHGLMLIFAVMQKCQDFLITDVLKRNVDIYIVYHAFDTIPDNRS